MSSPVVSGRKSIMSKSLYSLNEEFYPGKHPLINFFKKFQKYGNFKKKYYFTDEWSNDKLMSEMMYHFRPKQLNPTQYNGKMTFWKGMIENYCHYKGSSSFTIEELKDAFRRKGTSPYCLNDVVNQMISEGNVQDKDSFMSPTKSWTQWSIGLLATPMTWTFSKLKEKVFGSSDDAEISFISKSAVKKQAKILQDHVRNAHSYNNIISMEDLMQSSEDIDGISRDGILLALQYLSSVEKSVYMEENKEGECSQHHHKLLIKFSEPRRQVTPITHLERSVYNLETTEKFLISAIDKKEAQLNKIIENVKTCLKDGKKQMAKTHLKKKHLLENDITKTMNVLENIQQMVQRVHSSKSDREILQTYKIGAESIKHIFANAGVDIDNVYDVIEDMKEVLGEQDEMQNVISTPLREQEIEDAELEAELKELIDEEKGSGGGGVKGKVEEPKSDFNLSDLEMRLKRLRGDFPDLEDQSTTFTTEPKAKLTQ